ncbi:Methyltransferase type 11 [Pyrolobus fumarii 1A]|uniref:Methyltransferase type 11 n=1 Tax=Pyrolobus fumarii (strain DSM 11204 / 1A) TaxID=694429 RepID=G0ECD6_PYRF1|nr:methyltransferase domain-containing protein [Pyrolobus fumarii]AEM39506.1 Methyltransferase type 11 [Pyrolobus fumarii 1A]
MPDPRIIRDKYCSTATGYDELYREEQFEKYEVVFNEHRPKGVVADVGAGTCLLEEYFVTRNILSSVLYILALDLTPCMLDLCRERLSKLNVMHLVDIVECDAVHLPLRDNSVDESYAFTVFDLVSDAEKAIREQVRVTRKRAIYTLLKRAEAHRRFSLCQRYHGETSKDVICSPRAFNSN